MRAASIVVVVSSSLVLLGLVACGGSSGGNIPDPNATGGTSGAASSTTGGTTSSSSGTSGTSSGTTSSSSSSGDPDGGGSSGDGGLGGSTFDLRFAYLGVPLALGGNTIPIDFCIKVGSKVEGPVMHKLGVASGINVGQVSARFKAPAAQAFTVFLVAAANNTCPAINPIDNASIDIPPQLANSKATLGRLPVMGANALKLYVDEGLSAVANRANARLIHGAVGIDSTVSLEATAGGNADLFINVPFGGVTPTTFAGTSPNGYRLFVPFTNRQAQLTRDGDGKAISTGALSLKGAGVFSLFTYGAYKNGGGTLQLLGCNDDEMQGGFTTCVSAGWQEVAN